MNLCFTVILKCENGYQESYSLAYQPVPIWMHGDDCIVNMRESGTSYVKGSFRLLLNFHKNKGGRTLHPDKKCVLVCDQDWEKNAGYDDKTTLDRIISDIENEGFHIEVVRQ